MRIFLAKNYHEVCAGGGVQRVVVDWDFKPPRYYIEGDEKALEAMRSLGMLEVPRDGDDDGADGLATVPVEYTSKDKPPTGDLNPPAPRLPESYICRVHQKDHKKGSSLYAVCFSKNFKPSK